LGYVLQTAKYSANGIVLEKNFPLKSLVYEQSKMFCLRHHEFTKQQPNALIIIPSDEAYEREEQDKIEHEINRQQTINEWVNKVKQQLSERKNIVLDELMNTIFTEEKDFSIAYGVASEVVALASENPDINIEIKQQLTATQQNELALWKIKITT